MPLNDDFQAKVWINVSAPIITRKKKSKAPYRLHFSFASLCAKEGERFK